MLKLIACDLDETLLTTDKKISKEDIEAIQKARSQGIRFVVATGRGYHSLENILKPLDLYQKENEYIMSGNGAVLCESKDFRKLSFHGISFELANQLFEYGMQQDVCVQVFTDRDVYAFHINENEKKLKYTNIKDGWVYIGTKDVGFDQTINYDNGIKIPFEKDSFRIAPKNTVLMCIEGGSAGRKIAFTNQDVCFGNKLCCFNPYKYEVEKFLFYFLNLKTS